MSAISEFLVILNRGSLADEHNRLPAQGQGAYYWCVASPAVKIKRGQNYD